MLNGYRTKAGQMIFTVFSVIVLTISALTSFSFFYTFFGNLIPETLIDEIIRRIISGLVGMTLFDLAAVIWLYVFLYNSESAEQRAISLIMSIITFVGAASASVAYLSITATDLVELNPATYQSISVVALWIVILGVIMNFGASQLHARYSLENQEQVRIADRRDMIQKAESEQVKLLDRLVSQSMTEKLREMAPILAEEKAEELSFEFFGRESAAPEISQTTISDGHCQNCGKAITGKRKKYCTPACRQAAFRERQRSSK